MNKGDFQHGKKRAENLALGNLDIPIIILQMKAIFFNALTQFTGHSMLVCLVSRLTIISQTGLFIVK